MKKISFLFVFVILSLGSYASVTTISGVISGGEGMVIRLMRYADQISYLPETLDMDKAGPMGEFELNTEIEDITATYLEVNFQQGWIFIQPGNHYEVLVEPSEEGLGSDYYDRPPLGLDFVSDDEDNLNTLIRTFNGLYNDFILENGSRLHGQDRKKLLEQFISEADQSLGSERNSYLAGYVRYKIASMELFMGLKSKQTLAEIYLENDPVLYDNLEYMDFFHLFFEKYLVSNNRYFTYNEADRMVNGEAGIGAILDTLARDPFLQRNELREMVLMAGLKDMSNMSGFNKERITNLLEQLSRYTSIPENRKIALDLVRRIRWLQPGTPAPSFTLPDLEGKNVSLDDFRGKYTYLAMFRPDDMTSRFELDSLLRIYPEFKDRINFITIMVSETRPDSTGLSVTMPRPVLWFNDRFDLLDAYRANTFPYFILIDPKGLVYRFPAPAPSENLRGLFEGI